MNNSFKGGTFVNVANRRRSAEKAKMGSARAIHAGKPRMGSMNSDRTFPIGMAFLVVAMIVCSVMAMTADHQCPKQKRFILIEYKGKKVEKVYLVNEDTVGKWESSIGTYEIQEQRP